jgi:hypothetical protein
MPALGGCVGALSFIIKQDTGFYKTGSGGSFGFNTVWLYGLREQLGCLETTGNG